MDTTLFDRKGQPIAYIADDPGKTVYLWSGHAVAYVDQEALVGWNGRQLGFFVRGRVYDARGRQAGSIAEECAYVPQAESAKSAKQTKRLKHSPEPQRPRPKLSLAYAEAPLLNLLQRGAVPE